MKIRMIALVYIYICPLHARAGADMSRRMPVWCYIKRKVHEGKTNKNCNDLIEFEAARHTKNTANGLTCENKPVN
jgi:hypothetical protein